jgi:cephalosporin-C deacetylase
VLRPETYYYVRLITDAVRAVDTVRQHPAVDVNRVAVAGRSQGGGLALAAAALAPSVSAALVDVPFLCHFRRALEMTDRLPYDELRRFLSVHRDRVDRVFETLGYVDGMNFAARARPPALFSVGLMDEVAPPSTVFAAYNHYSGPGEIRTWPFSGHEAGSMHHVREQLTFLAGLWK